MVASARAARRSPRSLDGANTQSLFVYVDDVDAHCARAHWADRGYEALDREGHGWWFAQRLRTGGS
jgi:uncharacterized glyoxalase superfamily protein PhnB